MLGLLSPARRYVRPWGGRGESRIIVVYRNGSGSEISMMTHNFKGFVAAGFDLVGFTLRRKFILNNSNRDLMKRGCSRSEEGSSGSVAAARPKRPSPCAAALA
jgi:hypothetical protein